MKGEALSTDIGPASGGSLSPRVVVGVPPSDPPPSESMESIDSLDSPSGPIDALETKAPETKAPSTTRSSVSTILRGTNTDRIDTLPPPPSEPPVAQPIIVEAAPIVEEPKAEEPKVEEAKVEAPEPPRSIEPAPQSASSLLAATLVDAPKPQMDFASTIVDGSSEAAKVEVSKTEEKTEEERKDSSFAKTLAFGSKINELPQSERVETPKAIAERKQAARERLEAKRSEAKEAQKVVSPKEDPDEISVPPVINTDDEKFFDDADVAVRKSHHELLRLAQEEAEELVPEKARRKLDPHVIRRREKFVGYVKIAVAGAAIVCLAAVGRSAIHKNAKTDTTQTTQAIAAAPETPTTPAPVAEKAAEPAAAPAASAEPAATPEPAASAEPVKEEVTGDPKEELKKSRTALEKRKLPEAIEAGEKAVALDPTESEAWLILGASYQEKGDLKNAHRCYMACVKEGKTAAKSECQKMLR